MIETILETIRATLAIDAGSWLVGAHHVQANGSPPRYVWVPTNDTFGPGKVQRGHLRALYTRDAGVECHVWGTSLSDTEDRLHALAAALHADAATAFRLNGVAWDRSQANQRGYLAILSVTIAIPVTDATLTTALQTTQATGIECDDSAPLAGWVECCEPEPTP